MSSHHRIEVQVVLEMRMPQFRLFDPLSMEFGNALYYSASFSSARTSLNRSVSHKTRRFGNVQSPQTFASYRR